MAAPPVPAHSRAHLGVSPRTPAWPVAPVEVRAPAHPLPVTAGAPTRPAGRRPGAGKTRTVTPHPGGHPSDSPRTSGSPAAYARR